MKLKDEDQDLIRKYISVVDGIVAKYVPSTVPGIHQYNQMMTYMDLRKRISTLFARTEWEKSSKWRQIDLEEAINNEKKISHDNEFGDSSC